MTDNERLDKLENDLQELKVQYAFSLAIINSNILKNELQKSAKLDDDKLNIEIFNLDKELEQLKINVAISKEPFILVWELYEEWLRRFEEYIDVTFDSYHYFHL